VCLPVGQLLGEPGVVLQAEESAIEGIGGEMSPFVMPLVLFGSLVLGLVAIGVGSILLDAHLRKLANSGSGCPQVVPKSSDYGGIR
jgi:hypothetical protein